MRRAVILVALAIAGCGGSEEPTTTGLSPEEAIQRNALQEELETDLCSAVREGEGVLNEDGECRELPTCEEVAEGAELPADGSCLDVVKDD